jgi:predicted amidohydrolase
MSRRAELSVALVLALAACGGVERSPWEAPAGARTLDVVLVSLPPEGDPALNRERMVAALERVEAEHPSTRLVMFGELSLGWYWKGLDGQYQRAIAETLEGPTITQLREVARRHRRNVAFGFAELAGDKVYNAAVVIDASGEVVAHHRKTRLMPMDEWGGFAAGPRQPTRVSIDGIAAVLLVCADFNEPTLQADIAKDPSIQLVLLPQASAGLDPELVTRSPYPFNGKWMLAPQRMGTEGIDRYFGGWVVDPNGFVSAAATAELLPVKLALPAAAELPR